MSLALRGCLCVALAVLPGMAPAADDDLSKQVDAQVHKYIHDDGPGMAVLVVQDGKVVHRKGYGLADLAKKTPITPETNFDLASVSKQFTAMAVMILNDKEKLSFDDEVTQISSAARTSASLTSRTSSGRPALRASSSTTS